MMSSQLGRMILDGANTSGDEMDAAPEADGGYGPMDGLLDDIARGVRAEPVVGGDRRPGNRCSAD